MVITSKLINDFLGYIAYRDDGNRICPERAKMLEEAIREKLNPAKIVVMDTAGVSSMYANDGGVIVAV